ncbi:unnamed protein product [Meloidogyne enterolobii]|uniref:Uncharacterized protein n=1 Tax=Meloidogyne enterolobii TaxID=390850 RepID=A0ACB1ADK3_MELEN
MVQHSKTVEEATNSAHAPLIVYIKCVDGFFIPMQKNSQNKNIQFKGLFQMDSSSEPLAISENYKNLLHSLMITKPLYLATKVREALYEKDVYALLEIITTQKLEELITALKIMNVIDPEFDQVEIDFKNNRVDFNRFSEKQEIFDKGKLEQFLNWRFDQNCSEKPSFNEVNLKLRDILFINYEGSYF